MARYAVDGQRSANASSAPGAAEAHRRILVFAGSSLVAYLPDVFREMLDADASVVFSGKDVDKLKLPDELLAHPRVFVASLPLKRDASDGRSVALLRALADLNRFLSSDVDHGTWGRTRAARRVLKQLGSPDYETLCHRAADARLRSDVHARLTRAFRDLEHVVPPPPDLVEGIAGLGVDAVVFVTRCSVGGPEPDVIKAARMFGLPSIMLVWSWDNLSTKAMLNEHPDHLIVWNDVQAGEATAIHGIPEERIHVVGAPNFDRFFAEMEKHSSSGDGLADGKKTILYLGSSSDVARDEPAIFARWIAALRASGDAFLEAADVVVRPHPADRAWLSWTPPDPGVLLAPAGAKIEHETLARLLSRADAVVALNTTAEIEAAIANRPVLTFRAGQEAPGQEGRLHFSYLLEEHGGFVIDAGTIEEHLGRLAAVLRGDYDTAPIQRFVERFVRPAGPADPVSPLVASSVLELAAQGARAPR